MTVPTWFVVERHHGRLLTGMYYERLPTKYQGKRAAANGLVTAIRVDDKPHLAGRSRAEMHEAYELLGTLDQLHQTEPSQTLTSDTWPFG